MARKHGQQRGRSPAWLSSETAPGLVLMGLAAAALLAANSPWADLYHDLFHRPLAWTPVARLDSLHAWINDGAMAVFFFVVGLEIKREAISGALSHRHARRLPVIAAAAGMIVPATVYLAVTHGEPSLARGWAIPAATDIAFALGVLALVGKRVPPSLRLFLLAVAIVDDVGAIAIIAVIYTGSLAAAWLLAAVAIVAAMAALNRVGIKALAPYLLLALGLWYAVLHSGVHATVAGVAAALAIPLQIDRHGDSPLLRLEHALVPWTGLVIVPLFGFANAGVALAGGPVPERVTLLPWGIALGLGFGKQAGIVGSLYLADRCGLGRIPGVGWLQVWGMGLLCGIGFTMSLFVATLAFPGDAAAVDLAKIGILAGSLASAVAGYLVLRVAPARPLVP